MCLRCERRRFEGLSELRAWCGWEDPRSVAGLRLRSSSEPRASAEQYQRAASGDMHHVTTRGKHRKKAAEKFARWPQNSQLRKNQGAEGFDSGTGLVGVIEIEQSVGTDYIRLIKGPIRKVDRRFNANGLAVGSGIRSVEQAVA